MDGSIVRGTISGVVSQETFDADKEKQRVFLMEQRSALLAQVDAIERTLGLSPTTAQIRRRFREE